MRTAYTAIRENLRRYGEGRKKNYDLRVRKLDLKVSTCVSYYHPRRQTGRFSKMDTQLRQTNAGDQNIIPDECMYSEE